MKMMPTHSSQYSVCELTTFFSSRNTAAPIAGPTIVPVPPRITMLVGGRMIEGGGCGFNPKAPVHTVYPAGSNAPGVLHFGIDLAKPSDYIRKVMPDWEEPPVHMIAPTQGTGPSASCS